MTRCETDIEVMYPTPFYPGTEASRSSTSNPMDARKTTGDVTLAGGIVLVMVAC